MDARLFELAKQQVEVCKVFGSISRILILWTLDGGEMSVSQIAESVDLSIQNTSQHLLLMKDRGILTSRREGQIIYYSVCNPQGCTFPEIQFFVLRLVDQGISPRNGSRLCCFSKPASQ